MESMSRFRNDELLAATVTQKAPGHRSGQPCYFLSLSSLVTFLSHYISTQNNHMTSYTHILGSDMSLIIFWFRAVQGTHISPAAVKPSTSPHRNKHQFQARVLTRLYEH
jgi:hypothetical protein